MALNERSTAGKSVVIGAGTMGGGIAAQLADAGWSVRLLDVPGPATEDPKTRDATALNGLLRIKAARPPLLYVPEYASRIEPGNIDDDIAALADADWIVEAVAERLDVKRQVMQRIEAHAPAAAVVSTNTSGLSLHDMTSDRSQAFQRRFLGTHFFNPPRYVKLLELIALPTADPQVARDFVQFAETVLGRRVVLARDTPGFISNRVGMWAILDTIRRAEEAGLTVEEADYLTGPLIGRPKSGTFRLADLIGFDVISDIASSQYARLETDPYRDSLLLPAILSRLIEAGRLGEKTGAGFYRKQGAGITTLDFATLDYRLRREPAIEAARTIAALPLPDRLRAIRERRDEPWAAFLYGALGALSTYVRKVGPDIADDALSIDRVMQWGFNWEIGPFEMSDLMGYSPPGHFHVVGEGVQRRYRVFGDEELRPMPQEPHFLTLDMVRASGGLIEETDSASLLDLGNGVACVEMATKMNTFDAALVAFIDSARQRAEREFQALVIAGRGPHFSAGYNLRLFLNAIDARDWAAIDAMLSDLQTTFLGLKYARVPVVAATKGYALGGGCELTLHCTAVQAAVELGMGLPETTVGVVPAGGGTTEMLLRAMRPLPADADAFPAVEAAFERIVSTRTSSSAAEARKNGFLRATDAITINPDRLLFDAAEHARAIANGGYAPPVRSVVRVYGAEMLARLRMPLHWRWRSGAISDHDRLVADRIAWILSGGDLPHAQEVSEQYLLRLEREAFIALTREPKTRERIQHTLETGKPLRN